MNIDDLKEDIEELENENGEHNLIDSFEQFNLNYLTNEDVNKIVEIISKYKDK